MAGSRVQIPPPRPRKKENIMEKDTKIIMLTLPKSKFHAYDERTKETGLTLDELVSKDLTGNNESDNEKQETDKVGYVSKDITVTLPEMILKFYEDKSDQFGFSMNQAISQSIEISIAMAAILMENVPAENVQQMYSMAEQRVKEWEANGGRIS